MATTLRTHRLADEHKGYEIYLRNPGFEFTPVTLRKIASFVVKGTDKSLVRPKLDTQPTHCLPLDL